MPSTAIFCGVLLILIGLCGYIYGLTGENASLTALIPAIFGIVLAALGFASRANENLRKHLMHGAVLVALLGAIAIVIDFARAGWKFGMTAPVISKAAMLLICLIFVVLSIKSFVDARRNSINV